MKYSSILDLYTLEDILEYNDKTEEDCLRFLVEEEFVDIPEPLPLEFENE